jgi:hypothetical protein
MAIAYLAREETLGRHVALSGLSGGGSDKPTRVRRASVRRTRSLTGGAAAAISTPVRRSSESRR